MNKKLIENNDNLIIRLDNFLKLFIPELSRAKIQSLITEGLVYCNDQVVNNSSAKSVPGAIYLVKSLETPIKNHQLTPLAQNLDIVYEDQYLMVINKPAGLTVHPGAGNANNTLANILVNYSENLSKIGGEFRPGIVHRLDKDTSGLLMIAKDDITHNILSEAIKNKEVTRQYLAFTLGCPDVKAGTISTYIAKNNFKHDRMVITRSKGKEAITKFVIKENLLPKLATILECTLATGRTHQIRAQLDFKGFPIIGDQVYNINHNKYLRLFPNEIAKSVKEFPRQALHAYKLSFNHPVSDELLEFTQDLPEDMQKLYQDLKNHA